MSVQDTVRSAATRALSVAAALSFIAPLLTRITLGHAFFLTGGGKLEHFDNFVGFMTELGIPFPELNAHFVARLEYYGGIALILGIATRLVAAALASTMVVALLTSERQQFLTSWLPTGEVGPTDITPYVYFLLLAWVVLFGPGLVSLDHPLARWLRIGPAAPVGSPGKAA